MKIVKEKQDSQKDKSNTTATVQKEQDVAVVAKPVEQKSKSNESKSND